jgi:1-acyl-sn-glycerol-3-phosphate acyltransferase
MVDNQTSQWALLRTRRFLPFFLTQFAGAFNDNLFRNALVIMATFGVGTAAGADDGLVANIAAALFIAPFFLFSALAGQLADKYEKSILIRRIKLAEIAIMAVAAYGFWTNNIALLLGVICVLGLQATLFGPVKYALLPQQLHSDELVGGNAWIDAGTFVAILLGTLAGGALAASGTTAHRIVGVALLLFALLGWLAACAVPAAQASDPALTLRFNPFTETWKLIDAARANRTVFLSILGVSWFWFVGSLLLAQLPAWTRGVLSGDASVVTLLLACFSLGIGVGSLLCERLSGHKVEIGLVPLGSIGLTVFALDLYLARPVALAGPTLHWQTFLATDGGWRLAIDCALTGISGGLFIVPLYSLILQRSEASHRARIIACNNVLNAAFMVGAAALAVLALKLGFSIPQLILAAAILNAGVAIYIYSLVPEFLMRFLSWVLVNLLYRIRERGLQQIPQTGAALIVCNHVSFMDALILAGSVRRPVRFVMDHSIFRVPVLSFIFRTARAIPIAPAHENAALLAAAYERIDAELADGEIVGIFPEGKLTSDGQMNEFRKGVEKILARRPVPVVPMALRGLWGSFFSRRGGKAMQRLPRRFWSRIEVVAGEPVATAEANAAMLQQRVAALRGDWA